MADITATNLTKGGSGTSSSENTASISPGANKLILVSVQTFLNAGVPPIPTISGCGMTWVQIDTRRSSSDDDWRITMFRGLSSSPSAGALTISFGGTNNQAQWSVDELDNTSLSGTNGSGAIAQVASNDQAGTATGITVTLGAFANTLNATYGAVVLSGVKAISPGSGFAEVIESQNNGTIETEFKTENDTSVDWSWGSDSFAVVAMAIEIVKKSGGGFFAIL